MSPIDLHEPGPADAPALSALGIAAFTAKFAHLYRPEDLIPFLIESYGEAGLRRELADPARRFCLARRGGIPLGWAKLALTCAFPEHARGQHPMELKQLYTAPAAQGAGIGAALMDWAMATFAHAGADEIQLSVWSENHAAQRFYARYGFHKVADVTFRVGRQLDHEFLLARML